VWQDRRAAAYPVSLRVGDLPVGALQTRTTEGGYHRLAAVPAMRREDDAGAHGPERTRRGSANLRVPECDRSVTVPAKV